MRCVTRRAFTLLEVIVVVVIIVVLFAALMPAISYLRSVAKRTSLAADLNTLAIGLEAYKLDFGDYPRPGEHDYAPNRGAVILCRALLAPANMNGPGGDGADGFGFRTHRNGSVAIGRVFGPYLNPESFKLDLTNLAQPMILDDDGNVILYYVARAMQTNINLPLGYVASSAKLYSGEPGGSPFYNTYDNSGAYPDGVYRMRLMLGDMDLDGGIGGDETPAATGPYLLWCAGEDKLYGPVPDPSKLSMEERRQVRSKVDDVTNFVFR